MERAVIINGHLTEQDIKRILFQQTPCELDSQYYSVVNQSANMVNAIVESKKIVYGINTGFGSLANKHIHIKQLVELQRNLILSHSCGTGSLLDDAIVGLMMVLKINSFARGFSGVKPVILDTLLALYNHKVYPCIPQKGSVGASGDLAPLAHMSCPLIGEGQVRFNHKLMDSRTALNQIGYSEITLGPKEGLALINGLQASTAIALHAYFTSERLFHVGVLAGALSVDAAMGSDAPFDDRIHEARGLAAQRRVAKHYRTLLQGSEIRASHRQCERVQDPYSLRCQPQIMGAILHQMEFVKATLLSEANAITDNPLIFSQDSEILSGGNFHGEVVAMAADNLALAIAEIGANAERRIALLLDNQFSGLPPFLVESSGLNSGFMIAHVTAASCASDNKALSHPHSVDSIPTSANQEDHVSMATNSALRLTAMLDNTATILAIELLAACQGIDFRKPLKTSAPLERVHKLVRYFVPFYEKDRYFATDIAIIKQKILAGEFDDC